MTNRFLTLLIFFSLFLASFAFAHGGEDDIPEEEHLENVLLPEPYFSVGFVLVVLFAVAFAVNFFLGKAGKPSVSVEQLLFVSLVVLFISFAFLRFGASTALPVDEFEAQIAALLPSGKIVDGVRVIEVVTFKYGFDPDPVFVNEGDSVQFIVTSVDVPHGFQISPNYGIREDSIQMNEKRVVELVADEVGVFDMLCSSYCGSDHSVMKGKFIVKKRE